MASLPQLIIIVPTNQVIEFEAHLISPIWISPDEGTASASRARAAAAAPVQVNINKTLTEFKLSVQMHYIDIRNTDTENPVIY